MDLYFSSAISRRSQQRCSVGNGVPINFAKFTGKRLCQSLFIDKDAGNNFFTEHLRATAFKIGGSEYSFSLAVAHEL